MDASANTSLENRCLRCGTCCGAYDGDPCVHLKKGKDGRYYCEIYNSRFGMRKTVNGNTFRCVPVKEILNDSWFRNSSCPYKELKISYSPAHKTISQGIK